MFFRTVFLVRGHNYLAFLQKRLKVPLHLPLRNLDELTFSPACYRSLKAPEIVFQESLASGTRIHVVSLGSEIRKSGSFANGQFELCRQKDNYTFLLPFCKDARMA